MFTSLKHITLPVLAVCLALGPTALAGRAQNYGGNYSGSSPQNPNGTGFASLFQNPYGAAGSSNGYGGNGGSGYGSNGYGGNYSEDPSGAYLRGAAELMNSQGKWLLSMHQASILKELARQARIETRRKQLEEEDFEQSRTSKLNLRASGYRQGR